MTLKLIRKKLAELQDKILKIQTEADTALSKKQFTAFKKQQNILDQLKANFDKTAGSLEKATRKFKHKAT